MNTLWIVFGNHLFSPEHFKTEKKNTILFLAESYELCTHFRYHKQKIVLFLSAMRHFAEEMMNQGFKIDYYKLDDEHGNKTFEEKIKLSLIKNRIKRIQFFEIEDRFMEKRILDFCQNEKIESQILSNPMFLTTRQEFKDYLSRNKKPFMKTFYEWQRKRLKILVDPKGNPKGGQWSFDTQNRKKLPKNLIPPPVQFPTNSKTTLEILRMVEKRFSDHPGELKSFNYPVTRIDALGHFNDFLKNRFTHFGEFEDAMTTKSDFVYHSVLSPLLNTGLLTPKEVIDESLKFSEKHKIPINSTEGFIRQIIGWREFVRGIYQNYDSKQQNLNFFNHTRKLNSKWYSGTTEILPLDLAIQKVNRLGYLHHIERLMVVSNLMLLCEIHPQEAYKWFMEMFIDSSDWVMGPNVFGMGQFSDGGIFATKPYICGSNYILKMSEIPKGPWCAKMDALYWNFIDQKREFLLKNYRMSTMVRQYDLFNIEKKKSLKKTAQEVIESLTLKT